MAEVAKRRPKSETLRAIGLKVRSYREQRGWSQERLAELAQIHDRTISKIERGELNFSVLILLRVCKALDCTPNRLLDV